MNHARAHAAYATSVSHRGPRAQEADLFRRITGALRASQSLGPIAKTRALADNRRLWLAVCDLMRDPANQLPDVLRARIVAIGKAVLRELDSDRPNIDFLANVNDQIADALTN